MPRNPVTENTPSQPISAHSPHQVALEYPEQDMIDLVDLAAGIYRRRWLFLGTWLGVLVMGASYAFMRPPNYEFFTTIEIGTRVVSNRVVPLENGADVVVKLKKSYIPAALEASAGPLSKARARPSIQVDNARNSKLVVLRSTARAARRADIFALQQTIVRDLVEDHERQVAMIRAQFVQQLNGAELQLAALNDPTNLQVLLKPLERQLAKARSRLAELQDDDARSAAAAKLGAALDSAQNSRLRLGDDSEHYRAQLKRIDEQEKMLAAQSDRVSAQLVDAQTLRRSAALQANGSSEAMTLMLIDGQIQRREDLLTTLQKELVILLPDRKADLNAQLQDALRKVSVLDKKVLQAQVAFDRFATDWESTTQQQQNLVQNLIERITKTKNDQQRNIDKQRALIENIRTGMKNILATRSVLPPQQSPEPVGASRKIILLASLFLGGLLGLLAVGLAAFMEKLRARLLLA